MSLLKKIGYFLIGLSLGMIILTFILKGKNTEICYFPNCRVLKDIRSKDLSYSPEVQSLLDDQVLKTEDIALLLQDGDIDFRKSDTKDTSCKTYYIEGDVNEKATAIKVKNCDGYAEVIAVKTLND